MFDFGAQRIANFANSLKAMEMRLKYQQTGNEFYRILAEAYEDKKV